MSVFPSPSSSTLLASEDVTQKQSFPEKLYEIIENATEQGLAKWEGDGKIFKITEPERFADELLPHYFRQTKYKSFQRQLNVYGFKRIHHGVHKGGYIHSLFQKGYPDLCKSIARLSPYKSKAAVSYTIMHCNKAGKYYLTCVFVL